MHKRDWIASSNLIDYSTLNDEHNWEDLSIQLKNQQTCTSHKITNSEEVWFLLMFHVRFPYTQQI
jgi:subtilase family serine protease